MRVQLSHRVEKKTEHGEVRHGPGLMFTSQVGVSEFFDLIRHSS